MFGTTEARLPASATSPRGGLGRGACPEWPLQAAVPREAGLFCYSFGHKRVGTELEGSCSYRCPRRLKWAPAIHLRPLGYGGQRSVLG